MNMTESERRNTRSLANKLEAIGWGVFFIWMGIAFLADVGWGMGLLGVGVIAIGAQLARKYFALPVEGFWLVIGIAFAACGVWELLNIKASVPGGILPMLCVVAGIIILFSAFLRKPAH